MIREEIKAVQERVRELHRSSGIVLLNLVLIAISLELMSTGLIRLARTSVVAKIVATTGRQDIDSISYYLSLPYYSRQVWATRYWREHKAALRKRYQPYTIWRSPEFDGEMLKIDQSGIRQTPGVQCVPGAKRVFVFGGSAMWGWGAPDWGTIPAYLHKHFVAISDVPLCIVNFAENAYVSTQSVIQLALLLNAGNVPDLVVFYDGVNDVLAARQSGRPIVHQNFSEIAERFQEAGHPLMKWLHDRNISKWIRFAVRQRVAIYGGSSDSLPLDVDRLSGAIVEAYLNNYRMVEALAKAYQFDYKMFWQPHVLVGNKALTQDELAISKGLGWAVQVDGVLEGLFKGTYERIEVLARHYEHFHYAGNIFDSQDAQIWIDPWGHVTPLGNELVAREILKVLNMNVGLKR